MRKATKQRKTAGVLPFKPAAVVGSFAPVPELVSELEKLLALAKTGELRGLAWAGVSHDGHVPDGNVLSGWARGPYTRWGMFAALDRLHFRMSEEAWND